MQNALTIDVEDYFQVSALAESISPSEWDNIDCRVERNTDVFLEMFDRQSVKATFFVLGWVAERFPNVVKKIDEAGHEVASHGYSHQLVYNQDIETFRKETIASKQLLEDITGKQVLGYRAASYSITEASLWALDVLSEAGFKYDSSIFPVRHDRYGIAGAREEPHALTTPKGKKLAEFPISVYKCLGMNIPIAGGGYFRLFPYWFSRMGLKNVNSRGLPFVFYLHPWEVDPGQPKVKASFVSTFRHYNNLSKTEARLERLLNDFNFTTVESILTQQGLIDQIQT